MNVTAQVLESCDLHADRVAMVQDDRSIDYAELKNQILRLASILVPHAADSPPIAIALRRGIDATVAVLASHCAGRCYLPLDLSNPPGRLTQIVNDAQVALIIGEGPCPDWLPITNQWRDVEEIEAGPVAHDGICPGDAESLACILYTSGSTGQPKGVALSHRALHQFIAWAATTFAIDRRDRIASLAPLHFDLSIFDLFVGLGCGARIHFVPDRLTLTPSRLVNWLEEQGITTWYTVPSLLNFIALKGGLEKNPLPALRTLLFAGEVMPTQTLIRLVQAWSETRFYNLFGPTETNVCCYWPVDPSRLSKGEPIPIGQSACGLELEISEQTEELLVKGNNLFSGYWSQGRLNPRVKAQDWYPTGDRVSLAADGNFRYHGRIDRMLKCSGFRVEPAEIEAVITAIPGILCCAVVGIDDPASGQRPAASLVLEKNRNLSEIVPAIKTSLPAYMQPVRYQVFERLPALANGKTDYQAIQAKLAQKGHAD